MGEPATPRHGLDHHCAAARLEGAMAPGIWIVTLTGRWFVEVMDGTRVELGPGDVSLGEDRYKMPKARSGNIGDETVTLMVIELDVTPTVDQPCRFK
jgi:hypothetical protein